MGTIGEILKIPGSAPRQRPHDVDREWNWGKGPVSLDGNNRKPTAKDPSGANLVFLISLMSTFFYVYLYFLHYVI